MAAARLTLLLALLAPPAHSRRRGHGRAGASVPIAAGASHDGALASCDTCVTPNPDTGARYRIRHHHSGRYWYRSKDSIVASRTFFSLFALHTAAGSSAHALRENSGGWVHVAPGARRPLAVTGSSDGNLLAQSFWLRTAPAHGPNRYTLHLRANGSDEAIAQDASDPSGLGATGSPTLGDAAATPAVFELQLVVKPASERTAGRQGRDDEPTLGARARRSVTRVGGRDFVLVTYHNVGMLDWATLFWGWLASAGIQRFMLLELDGLTCEAARALGCPLDFECARASDLMLDSRYTKIENAGGMQAWGTDAESGYFKFLRWKLRVVQLLLQLGVDALMADVDVMVLSPEFFTSLVGSGHDLTISSDARVGTYDDNQHCPCSHPSYQRYSADWVCAGLFYMRATQPALWFIRQVQYLMDAFVITDQDAVQAVLTGHTQVAVPKHKTNTTTARGGAGRRSDVWMTPLWLEGLSEWQTLRNTDGIQPLNIPMQEAAWGEYQRRARAAGFSWRVVPIEQLGNGPLIVDRWESHFASGTGIPQPSTGDAADGDAVASAAVASAKRGRLLSVHANCNVKGFMAEEHRSSSYLLHPPPRATSLEHSHSQGDRPGSKPAGKKQQRKKKKPRHRSSAESDT